jgi:histidine triad (HIT) family protein
MASIFSKIVSGEIPAYKVAEDDRFLAFLDVFPLVKGHTLVIPKQEVDYLFNVDDELYRDLWLFAKKVSKGVEAAIPCKRIGVAVIGLEVPHCHIHLVPLNRVGDINFTQPKITVPAEEMAVIARKISSGIIL